MAFRELEAIDHGHIHYNLRSKLWEHILKRSEVCFAKNAAVREQIRTKEALDAYKTRSGSNPNGCTGYPFAPELLQRPERADK